MNNPFSNLNQKNKAHPFNDDRTEKQKAAEGQWESYTTLALLENNSDAKIALQSPEAQAANKIELARLRRLFWKVPESITIDPARPAEMPSEPELANA